MTNNSDSNSVLETLQFEISTTPAMGYQISTKLCSKLDDQHNVSLCLENVTNSIPTNTQQTEIWTPDVIQRVASLLIIMVFTFIGNTVIIIVLTCSRYRKRYSRVNLFIINLAVGDLTVCFVTMTTEILFVAFGEWVLGAVLCKVLTYLQVITLASTTFILTSMSFDRYMAICRPLRFRSSVTRARRMICISWMMAFVFAIPQLLIFVQTEDGRTADGRVIYRCKSLGYTEEWQRKVYFSFMTLYILIIPAIFISYCYVNVAIVVWRQGKLIAGTNPNSLRKSIVNTSAIPKAKIKTVKMTLCIIVSFIACWTPYFVTTLVKIYSKSTYIPPSVFAFAETVALLQSALNPIVYGFFTIKLKRGLTEIFCPEKLYRTERVRSFNVGMSDCLTLSGEIKLVKKAEEKEMPLKDNNSSTSSGSYDKRGTHCIIAEANTNGFKLRVRFLSKDTLYIHDRLDYNRNRDRKTNQEKEFIKFETTA